MALCGVHVESFEVGESVVVGVVEHRCPYLVLIPLLYAKHVVLIMVVGIKVRDVKIAIGQYHQYLVFVVELTHEASMRSEEHTSELQSRQYLVCRLLLEKKKRIRSPGTRCRFT